MGCGLGFGPAMEGSVGGATVPGERGGGRKLQVYIDPRGLGQGTGEDAFAVHSALVQLNVVAQTNIGQVHIAHNLVCGPTGNTKQA